MTETPDIVLQWVERAEYDLDAARALNQSGHLLYVAFLCQQAAEKMLKATWCHQHKDSPPYVHNLSTLVELLKLKLSPSQERLLERLNRYYIVGRYPSFKQKLSAAITKEDASEILRETEEFARWCRSSIRMSNPS